MVVKVHFKSVHCDCGWFKEVNSNKEVPIYCPNCEKKGINSFTVTFDKMEFLQDLKARHNRPLRLDFNIVLESPEDFRERRRGR